MEKIKEKIYRKALGMLQIKYSQIEQSSDSTPAEIEYCDDNIETACASAMSGGDYYWLISSKDFTERLYDWVDLKTGAVLDGEPAEGEEYKYNKRFYTYHGFDFGYKAPDDIFRPFLGNGEHNFGYARKGKEIYFAVENPTLDYIVDVTKYLTDSDEDTQARNEAFWADMPPVFIDLIAGMLAIAIAPMVAPEGTFGQNATTKMQTAAAACNDLNNNAYRPYRPSPKEYLE